MAKKVSEMTFKEYSEDVKKRGAHEIIEDPNFGMLTLLRKEGFSYEEINRMKMDKAWKLYMDSISVSIDQYITGISLIVEQHPERTQVFRPILEKLTEQLKKINREVEKGKR